MTHQLQLGTDVAAPALMIYRETITAVMTAAESVCCTLSHTCVCLPFSRASLVGREEYMVEDSPSFLGSTGLFGRAGKPEGRKRAELLFLNELNLSGVYFDETISLYVPWSKISFSRLVLRFLSQNSLSKSPRPEVYCSHATSGSWTTR